MSTFIYPVTSAAAGGATETTLSSVLTQVQELNSKTAGSLAPVKFDQQVITYVAAGNGVGEIQTVTYKLATVTVKTLTLSYDGSNRLSGVVAS
jgi:hypothetical protein